MNSWPFTVFEKYGIQLGAKMSTRQKQSAKVVQEKIPLPGAGRIVKSSESLKAEYPFLKPPFNKHHELRKTVSDEFLVQMRSSRDSKKHHLGSRESKDELVKHMSNLPRYLQQEERGENLQGKALNVGVLEWERLEKWKYHEGHVPVRGRMKTSSSQSNSSFTANGLVTLANATQTKDLYLQRKHNLSHNSLSSSNERRVFQVVHHSRGKVIHCKDSKNALRTTLDGQRSLHKKDKPSGVPGIKLDRATKSNQNTALGKAFSTPELENNVFTLSSKEAMGDQVLDTKRKEEERSHFSHHQCPKSNQNIVLLLPRHSPQGSCSKSFQFPESRALFHGKLTEGNGNRFPDCFSPKDFQSGESFSEIPHSCPLPLSVADITDSESNQWNSMEPKVMQPESDMQHPCANSSQMPVAQSEVNCLEESKSNMEPTTSTAMKTPKRSGQDLSEKSAAKGRHPSPNRRFSFSLSRMSRSFSFKESKEGSSVPQLSPSYISVKSGPISSDTSFGLDNLTRAKANVSSRGSSSPLRRLLDPLLGPKGAHSAEAIQQSKINSSLVSVKLTNSNGLIQDDMHKATTVKAFLQLTVKNGLPLFKLATDDSSDILAATVKKLSASEKGDSSLIYVFYSVHEIKKSRSWINQEPRGRVGSFRYIILGYLKASSYRMPDFSGQNSKDQFVLREFVLFSAGNAIQADKENPELMPDGELAAIVVKGPIENFNEAEQRNCGKHYIGNGFMEFLSEDTFEKEKHEHSSSTTVILPAGIHGLPTEGAPSSLINRWRSGGLCDCGGWDVGCKLRILTNQNQNSKTLRPCSPDFCDLYLQDGKQENKPTFRLAPLNSGLYSIEFDASLSLLKAFSICVAVLTSGKSSDLLGKANPLGAKLCPGPMTGSDGKKTFVRGGVPATFFSSPPPSPFGRV